MSTLTVPQPVPSPAEDAKSLWKACKGWGTDEKTVISILAHRDAAHRKQIMVAFEARYNENLVKRLESELSGNFEKAVYRWIFDSVERSALFAFVALKKEKVDVDYPVIIEIACTVENTELMAVKQVYLARYTASLEEDVSEHTSGDLRKLLVALVSSSRYDGEEVDLSLAKSEAKILNDAIGDEDGHDEIIRILSTRSKPQLIATFRCFEEEFNTSITKSLSKATYDELVYAFLIAVRCIIDPKLYYEKLLRYVLITNKKVGGRTEQLDKDALTRVIVTRAEKDLKLIKEIYFKNTNVTLEHSIGKETSGDYKSFLLALLGAN